MMQNKRVTIEFDRPALSGPCHDWVLSAIEWIVPGGLFIVLAAYILFGLGRDAKAYWPDHVGMTRTSGGLPASGLLPAGMDCLRFNNGTFEQVCSLADGSLQIEDSTGAYILSIETKSAYFNVSTPTPIVGLDGPRFLVQGQSTYPGGAAGDDAGTLVGQSGNPGMKITIDAVNPDGGTCAFDNVRLWESGASTVLTYGTSFCVGGTCPDKASASASLTTAINGLTYYAATNPADDLVYVWPKSNAIGAQLDVNAAGCMTGTNTGTANAAAYNGMMIGTSWLTSDNDLAGSMRIGTTRGDDNGYLSLFQLTSDYILGGPMVIGNLGTSVDGGWGIFLMDSKGAQTLWTRNQETLTFSAAGESTKTTAALIPDGATGVHVSGRVIVSNSTGACTGLNIGDGSTVDLYASGVGVVAGQKFSDVNATGTLAWNTTSAGNVTVTTIGGTCKDLQIRIKATYFLDTADTSN